jgi:hypothetical protein
MGSSSSRIDFSGGSEEKCGWSATRGKVIPNSRAGRKNLVKRSQTFETRECLRELIRNTFNSQFRLPAYRLTFSSRENFWNSESAVEINRILGEIDGLAV